MHIRAAAADYFQFEIWKGHQNFLCQRKRDTYWSTVQDIIIVICMRDLRAHTELQL